MTWSYHLAAVIALAILAATHTEATVTLPKSVLPLKDLTQLDTQDGLLLVYRDWNPDIQHILATLSHVAESPIDHLTIISPIPCFAQHGVSELSDMPNLPLSSELRRELLTSKTPSIFYFHVKEGAKKYDGPLTAMNLIFFASQWRLRNVTKFEQVRKLVRMHDVAELIVYKTLEDSSEEYKAVQELSNLQPSWRGRAKIAPLSIIPSKLWENAEVSAIHCKLRVPKKWCEEDRNRVTLTLVHRNESSTGLALRVLHLPLPRNEGEKKEWRSNILPVVNRYYQAFAMPRLPELSDETFYQSYARATNASFHQDPIIHDDFVQKKIAERWELFNNFSKKDLDGIIVIAIVPTMSVYREGIPYPPWLRALLRLPPSISGSFIIDASASPILAESLLVSVPAWSNYRDGYLESAPLHAGTVLVVDTAIGEVTFSLDVMRDTSPHFLISTITDAATHVVPPSSAWTVKEYYVSSMKLTMFRVTQFQISPSILRAAEVAIWDGDIRTAATLTLRHSWLPSMVRAKAGKFVIAGPMSDKLHQKAVQAVLSSRKSSLHPPVLSLRTHVGEWIVVTAPTNSSTATEILEFLLAEYVSPGSEEKFIKHRVRQEMLHEKQWLMRIRKKINPKFDDEPEISVTLPDEL